MHIGTIHTNVTYKSFLTTNVYLQSKFLHPSIRRTARILFNKWLNQKSIEKNFDNYHYGFYLFHKKTDELSRRWLILINFIYERRNMCIVESEK